jgi:uncharacterized protein (TIGR03437 family)
VAFIQGKNLGNSSAPVLVGTKAAYVINALGGGTLQVQLPVDAPLGPTTLTVGNSAPFNISLVQYCPAEPTDGQQDNLVSAFHYPSGTPVTFGHPASPNEQIAVGATGLGPTNPAYGTGTAPPDSSAVTVTKPAVTVAGQGAAVSSAFLQPNSPGFYAVVFTVPGSVTSGNQNITVSIAGLSSNQAILPVTTGPIIATLTNAASYNDPALPNGPIAQGSIFVIKGNNLGPSTLSIAPAAFQSSSLSGTSLSVSINGTTVSPLMYYTSTGQVAALMPSNTPAGAGTITATYNGQPGPAAPVRVVANNLGIFTATSDGQGAGIVTYADYSLVSTAKAANCGGVYTTCGAANPGDVLIVWATGLGPVSGSDASGAGLGVNMTDVPLTIWLGGVQVQAAYQGRSGCCIGEDQIVFTMPANVPTGCAVPLAVQIGNFVSNSVALPVASAGNRTCTPADPAFAVSAVAGLTGGNGTETFGGIDLRRTDKFPGFQDLVKAQFIRFSVAAAVQPFFLSYVDSPPAGTCQVFNTNNSNTPLTILSGLDIGPQLTVQGPGGSKSVNASGGNFQTTLSGSGNYFAPGTYTVSASGGADVPAVSGSITVPAFPTMTSPQPDSVNQFSVTRSNGLTVTWSGGSANTYVELDGFSNTDNSGTAGANFKCLTPSAPGTFTIPPYVLLALPPGNFGGMDFYPTVLPVNLSGTGLNVNQLTFRYDYFANLAFK